jgi:hypothetical protein
VNRQKVGRIAGDVGPSEFGKSEPGAETVSVIVPGYVERAVKRKMKTVSERKSFPMFIYKDGLPGNDELLLV